MPAAILVLPWRGNARIKHADRRLVFASRFDANGWRSAFTLMLRSAAVYRAAAKAPGCRGASLVARPIKRAYYTMSVWDDETALAAFARSTTHRKAIVALWSAGEVDGVLMSWWTDGPGRPTWGEVIRRTSAAPTGSYRGPETNEPQDGGASLSA